VLQNFHGVGAFWKLILGLGFVVLVTLFRGGLAGSVHEIARRLRARGIEAPPGPAAADRAPGATGRARP
jgi:hypothetical protein